MTALAGSSTVKASVVIPTYKDWNGTADCLRALASQDLPLSEFEVIVVNNNPTADVPVDLPLQKNMRVVWVVTPGSYAARNAGVAETCGAFIFFIDADCKPNLSWLTQGLAEFDEDPSCYRIAGAVEVVPTNGVWNGWSLYDSVFNLQQENYVKKGFAVTANLAVRRELFDNVGPFREASFSGEDKEWNKRASAAGVPLTFLDSMSVQHPARTTFIDNAQKRRRLAGARFVAKSGRRVAQSMPRFHYILPSLPAFIKIWRHPVTVPVSTRLSAMWCHYMLGWVHNAEVVRLGLLGGALER
jgi:GT2 family glycosyltransferase